MPQFFFDTDDGRFQFQDEEGREMPHVHAARDEAVATLPEMVQTKLPAGERREYAVRIRDEHGVTVYTAILSIVGEWHVEVPPKPRG